MYISEIYDVKYNIIAIYYNDTIYLPTNILELVGERVAVLVFLWLGMNKVGL